MEHRGEIIEQAVRKSGISIATVAKKMGKSRRWLYLQFENPNVSIDIIIQLGKIIYYDFSEDIQLLKTSSLVADSGESKIQMDVNYWKEKYYQIMEEYHILLKKMASMDK